MGAKAHRLGDGEKVKQQGPSKKLRGRKKMGISGWQKNTGQKTQKSRLQFIGGGKRGSTYKLE